MEFPRPPLQQELLSCVLPVSSPRSSAHRQKEKRCRSPDAGASKRKLTNWKFRSVFYWSQATGIGRRFIQRPICARMHLSSNKSDRG